MKTISMIVTLVLFLIVPWVGAEPGDTASKARTVTWVKDNPEPDLAGFKVYNNGEFVADIPDPLSREWVGEVANLIEGINHFTTTAYDQSGNESGYSPDGNFKFDLTSPIAPTSTIVITIETR